MRFDKLKVRLFTKVPDNYREDLQHEIDRINLSRSKIVSVAFIIMEVMMMPLFFISKRGVYWENRDPLYVGLYVLFAGAMAMYFVISLRLEKKLQKNRKLTRLLPILLSCTILIWCAAIALLDQLSTGQMIAYICAIFTVSIFPLLSPLALLEVYLPAHILFLLMLPVFQPNADFLFGNIINSSVCVVIAFIIAGALYRSKCSDIVNKFIIQGKNKELSDINEKLLLANQRLEQISFTDSLTGLLNRRRLDERLCAEWERCKRYSIPLSLLILDIDSFKRINDIYGHQTGDVCITRVSSILKSMSQRSSDIVARWGGEEFIIAMPHIEKAKAYGLAEQIREEVESMNDFSDDFGIKDRVTVSIGLCSAVPSDKFTVREMIEAADKALYSAKSKKGNKTEFAEDFEPELEYKQII